MAPKTKIAAMIAPTLFFITCSWLVGSNAFAALASSALLKAKHHAEANGYIFFTSHNDIVEMAKREGKLRVAANMGRSAIKATTAAFKKKYSFIDDIYIAETTGTETAQRMLLEIQSGAAKEWDIVDVTVQVRSGFNPVVEYKVTEPVPARLSEADSAASGVCKRRLLSRPGL